MASHKTRLDRLVQKRSPGGCCPVCGYEPGGIHTICVVRPFGTQLKPTPPRPVCPQCGGPAGAIAIVEEASGEGPGGAGLSEVVPLLAEGEGAPRA